MVAGKHGCCPKAPRFLPGCSRAKRKVAIGTYAGTSAFRILGPYLAVGLCCLAGARVAAAGTPRERFEGPNRSWISGQTDIRYRLSAHDRVRDVFHSGGGSERIAYEASNGTHLYFHHQVRPSRIIEELVPSIWIKGNRPGVQLFVRAVLPRSIDPNTGQPLWAWLAGSSYDRVGSWQKLRATGLPAILLQQARVLRSQFGTSVDTREAYVDQIRINAYGGIGENVLWLDDLEIEGHVDYQQALASRSTIRPVLANPSAASAHLKEGLIRIGDRVILPRVITYHGEPLEQLAAIGFNVVQLPSLPDQSMLREASRLELWFISPPPSPDRLRQNASEETYLPIIAWHLGQGLGHAQIETTQSWAQLVRRWDPQNGRPLVAEPASDIRAYSRLVDILVLGRHPLGTTLELDDYAKWIEWQPRLARPGTPIWMRIQTDHDPAVLGQWNAQTITSPSPPSIDSFQIQRLVQTSIAAGARGLVFDSHSPLTTPDPTSRRRLLGLEWIHLQLGLIEPWSTSGSFVTTASSDDPNVNGVALQTDRARLLLPMRSANYDQFVPLRVADGTLSFVIPGVPGTNNAYGLSPVEMKPLRHKRVAGGIRVTQDRMGAASMILLTGDPRIVSDFAHRIAKDRRRAAELLRELADLEWQELEQVLRHLDQAIGKSSASATALVQARQSLDSSRGFWDRSDFTQSYLLSRRAMRWMGQARRSLWKASVVSWPSTISSPFALCFSGLPNHWRFARQLSTATRGPNLLRGGDLEGLDAATRAGWRHTQFAISGVQSDVEFSPSEPHGGNYSLRLKAWPRDAEQPNTILEAAPAWVTSAPVSVVEGQWIRINGYVRMPKPLDGSVDGLFIFDSLSGQALAERILVAPEWKEFTLYRVATRDANVRLTFALTGLGEAWIDDVTITVITNHNSQITNNKQMPNYKYQTR